MMPVAARLPLQNFLRQERFAPERHQAFRVEVFGMEGPEAHDLEIGVVSQDDHLRGDGESVRKYLFTNSKYPRNGSTEIPVSQAM